MLSNAKEETWILENWGHEGQQIRSCCCCQIHIAHCKVAVSGELELCVCWVVVAGL